jgi:hypothetical protein
MAAAINPECYVASADAQATPLSSLGVVVNGYSAKPDLSAAQAPSE